MDALWWLVLVVGLVVSWLLWSAKSDMNDRLEQIRSDLGADLKHIQARLSNDLAPDLKQIEARFGEMQAEVVRTLEDLREELEDVKSAIEDVKSAVEAVEKAVEATAPETLEDDDE